MNSQYSLMAVQTSMFMLRLRWTSWVVPFWGMKVGRLPLCPGSAAEVCHVSILASGLREILYCRIRVDE